MYYCYRIMYAYHNVDRLYKGCLFYFRLKGGLELFVLFIMSL